MVSGRNIIFSQYFEYFNLFILVIPYYTSYCLTLNMVRVPKVDASVLETHIIKYRTEIVKEDGKSKYSILYS